MRAGARRPGAAVEPVSVEANEKAGVVLVEGSLGCAVIEVLGAVVSTVQV